MKLALTTPKDLFICKLPARKKNPKQLVYLTSLSRFAPAPLGSIRELPAISCKEIKASEGGQAVSGYYWLDLIRSGDSFLTYCDMVKEGEKEIIPPGFSLTFFFHQHYILLFSLTVVYTLRRSPALWYFPPNFLILEFFCTNFIADISYSRFNFCKVNFGYVSSSPVFSSISSSIAEAFVNTFTFSILFPFVLYRCCYLSIWVAR